MGDNRILHDKLPCPTCNGSLSYIKDSRPHEVGGIKMIKRRRSCSDCGLRHSTFEMMEEDILAVSLVMRKIAEDELRELDARREALLSRVASLSTDPPQ